MRTLITIAAILICGDAASATEMMELPAEVRAWFRNPDGSCVQCSIGMCGAWSNVPAATMLLWDTRYGSAVRGGSWPSRVASYCNARGIRAYNVTGDATHSWMMWAAKTGRFAAVGAGQAHFQTLYGKDAANKLWFVCNNNSTHKIDEYTQAGFDRLHHASGHWGVILAGPAPPAVPVYRQWW